MFEISTVVNFFKKTFTRKDVLLVLVLIALFAATRLINLDKFPIFSDEGIYIHWAKVAWHDASWRFISLTDGKQPLQTWGTIPFLKLFSSNMLLGGRMFAVSMGFLGLMGMYSFLLYLFGKRTAFWGACIFILTPYFLFYDRLALVDSGVNAAFIWVLFLSVVLAQKRRLDMAFIFGIIGGIGLLAKSSVQLFLGLSAFAPVLFFTKKKPQFISNALNYYILYGIGVVIAFAMYNIQRLSPFLHFVGEKNTTFIMSFAEFKAHPFSLLATNVPLIPLYVAWESGFVLALLAVVGAFLLYKKNRSLFMYLMIWLVIPYIGISFFNKVLFPRYLIFFPSLLVIFAAAFVQYAKPTLLKKVLLTLFVVSCLIFNYTIWFKPATIPFPQVDRGQYIEGWPAGTGMKESMDYIRAHSSDKPALILAEGNFGMAYDVLDSLLKPTDTITITGYWPLGEAELIKHQIDLEKKHVFVVFGHKEEFPSTWPLKLIKKYEKPGNKSAIYLFELTK